ncbi:GNAT family N-acetyltransferase [Microvirga guangxiensis]|uniref:Ribosomal-protein-alanine N-acetyltransferase n=1 Tax=Microvirga guangxiensis TaxID=549386 RepID=A0A1G5G4A3_9HYPH|nr:GNAT family N-acetyltransferase [Microvirga guangxiensis]SCY46342.1 ribosomal-protein-alanine N-acetyltransferase [Microvirga guangxiensis]
MSFFDLFKRPSGLRIDPLGTDSASRLAAIHGASFAQPWSTLEFERLLGERGVVGDGVFLGSATKPSGFVLSRIVLDEAEILTVAIAPDARGKGYSIPLLERHLDELSRRAVRNVYLEVEEGNDPALALYRRFGFEETGRREGYYQKADGTRVAALTMTLGL